jgi:hypothetical protein
MIIFALLNKQHFLTAVNTHMFIAVGEIKSKTLQVGINLACPLLGFFGFQKSEQLHATERGLFSFLRHP